MARAVLPGLPHQPDLRRDERDPAHRHRTRRPQAGGLLSRRPASTARAWLAALAWLAVLATAACSEEDRRAWVSILPSSGDDEPEESGGPIGLTPDSTAVVAGSDTLFHVRRVPAEAGGRAARIGGAAISPDSTAIALKIVGPVPAVLVWSRPRQTAVVVRTYPEGEVVGMDWSPGGRLLAFNGREAAGTARGGIFDAETGLLGRHVALRWLERRGQSVRFQSWAAPGRARFLVGPAEGGLAYLWDVPNGMFVLESHIASLTSQPPPGAPQRGGVFSIDLGGDPAPETVALFRAVDGAPGAQVLVDAGAGGARGVSTVPLLPAAAFGLEEWKAATRGAELYQIVELGGRPTLLLALPSQSPFAAIAFFQLGAGGALEAVPLVTASGTAPAILPEGRSGDETKQLGIVDLDGDGSDEVVSATGRSTGGQVTWSAEVFRWEGGRLVPAPALAPAAVERVERMVEGR